MSSEKISLQESVDQNHQNNEGYGKNLNAKYKVDQEDNAAEVTENETPSSNDEDEEDEKEVKQILESSNSIGDKSETGSDWYDDEIDNENSEEYYDDEEDNDIQLERILRQIARLRELFDTDSDENDEGSDSDDSFYDESDDDDDLLDDDEDDARFISDLAELEQFMNEQGMHPWDDEEREMALTFLTNQEDS